MDIIERLRFDSARCEATFSKGVARNIDEAVREIERLRTALLAVRNEALEEAAKVAGEMPYLEPNDDYSPDFNEGWATASAIIAKVIRAMKATTG